MSKHKISKILIENQQKKIDIDQLTLDLIAPDYVCPIDQ